MNHQTAIEIQDEDIEIKSAQEDPQQFRTLYERYFKKIFLFIHHRVEDKDATADITSQVFMKAMINLKTYKNKGVPFSAWLFKIASNEINQYYRINNKYRKVVIDDLMMERMAEETEGPNVEELKNNIEKIINLLSPADVFLIELRFFEAKSYREISYLTGTSESTAKTRLWRILERVRKRVKFYE